jgi:DNA polymerase/3'-5' exonuclease PolX
LRRCLRNPAPPQTRAGQKGEGRMEREKVWPFAEKLADLLRPACEEVVVGGGLRRNKPDCHDIEIVALPRTTADMFSDGGADFDLVGCVIDGFAQAGMLRWDEKVRRNGTRYKRLIVPELGIPVEFFMADREQWGLQLALRTGSKEFNHWFVTKRLYGGGMPDAMKMEGGYLWRVDAVTAVQGTLVSRVEVPTEEAFFAALDLPCLEPADREQGRFEGLVARYRKCAHDPHGAAEGR